jgi:two-component system CheB/CheR fusion protein
MASRNISTGKNPAPKKTSAKSAASKKATAKTGGKKKSVSKKTAKKPVKPAGSANEPGCIVGIGASAGGLEALEGLIPGITVPNSMAFVIIQHLAPKHKSIMGALLAKHTDMNINEIKDGMLLEPNNIYLNPPDRDVSVLNGHLYLTVPMETHATRLPIDYFLRSLAQDQKERAVGIILSGTGTDGSLGLKAIKGEGGMTMAQEEAQAKYDSMPRNAINTGLVDFILPVEKMGGELSRYAKHPYIEEARKAVTPRQEYLTSIKKIFLLIRSTTGHDFSNYKQNTVRRRIERRMAVHQISRIEEYHRYLRETPPEVETLFKDMLIGVTNFFRDPAAFELLEKEIIPDMLDKKEMDGNLRIWVPGCATGEEAYSMAILILEAMEKMKKHLNVQIFATDIDDEAIGFARAGLYPDSIAADLSSRRLKRFFTKIDSMYSVKKQVREMVVFAVQNLIKDPPFSRLDLVSCRNVLIYMDTPLQKKILPLFHYTLAHDGYLFLGTSESIGEFAEYFSPVSTKWKVFRRKGVSMDRMVEHHALPFYETAPEMDKPGAKKVMAEINTRSLAEGLILQNYAPACVLINETFNIVYFHGKTDMFLTAPSGEPTFNILKMAREELRYKLSSLLHKAAKQKKPVAAEALQISYEGRVKFIDLIVRPLPEHLAPAGMMLVVFEDRLPPEAIVAKSKTKKTAVSSDIDPRIAAIEQELQSTKEYLQTTIEELETSNEELKSTNEELQSTNEELQSTNEEMETSKEELQSTKAFTGKQRPEQPPFEH